VSAPAAARVELFGAAFTPLTLAAAAAAIAARPERAPFDYVVTPNAANIVAIARERERLDPVWRGAWLSLLDSAVTQLLARLFGIALPLVPGSDLTAHLFASGIVAPDRPVAIIGCTAATIARLRARYGLREVLHHEPPMGFLGDAAALAAVVDFAAAAHTRFVFFAIGAPQAQILAARIRGDGRATGLGFCIGASLNFLAGVETRAPRWVRRLRLEWLFRTIQQPRRIGRRVIVDCLPLFAIALRERRRRRTG
jgi:N-acetylglucosaminyldiphosphoundecaprenol N-acetyl-beta-D-mannosaminyltransferase